jgi:MPBQ/MSBQ methyltransferase
VIGPVRPANRLARRLAEAWMLFPAPEEYVGWFEAAGFADVHSRALAPDWHHGPYALAVSGVKPAAGPSPLAIGGEPEDLRAPLSAAGRARVALRFLAGSAAGAAFLPIGAALALRARLRR